MLKFVEKVPNLATCLHTTLSEFHFHFFLVTSLSGNYYVLLLLVCRLATLNKIKKRGPVKKMLSRLLNNIFVEFSHHIIKIFLLSVLSFVGQMFGLPFCAMEN